MVNTVSMRMVVGFIMDGMGVVIYVGEEDTEEHEGGFGTRGLNGVVPTRHLRASVFYLTRLNEYYDFHSWIS